MLILARTYASALTKVDVPCRRFDRHFQSRCRSVLDLADCGGDRLSVEPAVQAHKPVRFGVFEIDVQAGELRKRLECRPLLDVLRSGSRRKRVVPAEDRHLGNLCTGGGVALSSRPGLTERSGFAMHPTFIAGVAAWPHSAISIFGEKYVIEKLLF